MRKYDKKGRNASAISMVSFGEKPYNEGMKKSRKKRSQKEVKESKRTEKP